ncbi:ureidoglycolate lyase [Agrobacterium rhizogenes]|uniref:ureidoglycolate lyase n=1 Tax=Rhizobium rhizogenes TaxID=359 RepID=UPI0022B61A83|nr:ureidoglycolate lyase [Rhizobium rhizogenes]MCZ7448433.1 ureidoglycolate lyase [Rhizobium rhizogenes]
MKPVIVRPLTAEAFAPFGSVADISSLDQLASLTHAYEGTGDAKTPVLQLVQAKAMPGARFISQMEIHPFSSQTFLPLDQSSSLIVVCEAGEDGTPDETTFQAFLAGPSQIVTYRCGVMHHRLTPLAPSGIFAMTMWQTGRGGDTVLYPLQTPVSVDMSNISS